MRRGKSGKLALGRCHAVLQCEGARSCSSTLPAKLNQAHTHLAGILTCASTSLNGLPRRTPQWLRTDCQALDAYSYGVATDLHRLPDTRYKEYTSTCKSIGSGRICDCGKYKWLLYKRISDLLSHQSCIPVTKKIGYCTVTGRKVGRAIKDHATFGLPEGSKDKPLGRGLIGVVSSISVSGLSPGDPATPPTRPVRLR